MFRKSGNVDAGWLESISFFADLDHDHLNEAARLGKRRDVKAGETVIEQGRFGRECYVISEGNGAVYIGGDYVNSVGPGVTIGEMAIVEHRPRNATIVAETDMVLVEFGIEEFKKFLADNPIAHDRVIALLNSRIKENTERG